MKKSQKILIGLLIVVLIAVTVIIINVKSPGSERQSENFNASTIFVTDEAGNTIAVTQGTVNHQQVPESGSDSISSYHTEKDKNNSGNSSDKNNKVTTTVSEISSDKNSSSSNKTDYNLENAELMQTQKTSYGELKLYSLNSNGKSIYLFTIEKDEKIFYKEIPGSYIIENIFYANLDGKFGDEIIVHANKSPGSTLPPKYENYVFKITSEGFEELFDPSSVSLGYSGSLKNNYSVEITNSKTGMKKVVNLKDSPLAEKYWDEKGNVLSPDSKVKFESTFCTFEPYDYDDDGLFEIACNQYVSLTSQKDHIGYARTIMKYDYTTKKIEIIETFFN